MRITKTIVSEFITLTKNHGYWSQEVRNFLGKFDYVQAQKLHNKASELLGNSITKL